MGISSSEWARLTGQKPRLPNGVAGLSLGPCVAGVFTDPALASLDLKIHRLTNDIGGVTPTTQAGVAVLLSSNGLLVRWAPFFELHKDDIFADPNVRAMFDQFTREYNDLLVSWKQIGGQTSETPSSEIPINPDNAPGSTASLLDSLKWIAIAGLAAYVLVGTGAVAAVGALIAGTRK